MSQIVLQSAMPGTYVREGDFHAPPLELDLLPPAFAKVHDVDQ